MILHSLHVFALGLAILLSSCGGSGGGGDGGTGGDADDMDAPESTAPATTGQPSTDTGDTTGGANACEPTVHGIPEAAFAQVFATTLCAQKEACGCAPEAGCEAMFLAEFNVLVAYAADNELHYDEACAIESLTDFVTSRGCARASGAFALPCSFPCDVFSGDLAEGEACSDMGGPAIRWLSDPCAGDDVFCSDGVCVDPPLLDLKLGDTCDSDTETVFGVCEPGTVCDYFDSQQCEPALHEGDECVVQLGVCDDDTFCTPGGVCDAYRRPGEPCTSHYDCTSVRCWAGTCEDFVWICEVNDVDDFMGRVK